MNDLIIVDGKITSLELVKEINLFRKKERDGGDVGRLSNDITHKSLLEVIRDEFNDEINEHELTPVEYKDKKGESRPMFNLTIPQAKQVLVRESKVVRKAIIKRLDELENKRIDSYMIDDRVLRAKAWIVEEETRIELAKQLEYANKTKSQISDKKTATALATASAMVRKNNVLERKLKEFEHTEKNEKYYTVTELARTINVSAVKLNSMLRDQGLQYDENINNKKVWFVTKTGAEYAGTKTTVIKNDRFDTEHTTLVWSKKVLDMLEY